MSLRLRVKLTEEGGFDKKTAPLGAKDEGVKSEEDLELQAER